MVYSGRLDVLIPGFHWRGWIFPAGAGLLLSWVMLTRHSDTGHKLLCWTRRQSANSPLFSSSFKDPWLLRNDPGSFTQQLTLSRVTSLLPVRMQHWEGNWLNFFFFFFCSVFLRRRNWWKMQSPLKFLSEPVLTEHPDMEGCFPDILVAASGNESCSGLENWRNVRRPTQIKHCKKIMPAVQC